MKKIKPENKAMPTAVTSKVGPMDWIAQWLSMHFAVSYESISLRRTYDAEVEER